MSLAVVLVDPMPVLRAGLGLLISAQPDMEMVAGVSSADEASQAIQRLRTKKDVVVVISLDLQGERDSSWLIRSIREKFPSLPVLVSGSNVDEMTISRALFVGADGFVDRRAEPQEFLQALRMAAEGEMVLQGMPPTWLGPIVDGLHEQRDGSAVLTDREREVLATAAEGLTARQIGTRLGVSERTVTTHLGRIYKKLGAGSRVAAIATATRSGLVTVDKA